MTFVELLDRRGRVRGRVKVTELPFRIGRGYDCDLILDDPHVSPLHAVLEADAEGRLVLRDAGSRNGLIPGERGEPVPQVALEGDLTVQLGRTLLRVRGADFRVPDALPIVRRSPVVEWALEHWSAAFVIPALCMAILVFDQWRKSTTFFEPTEVLSTVSWSLLAYGVWIGGWALLNRLLRHRTRLVAHASVAFVASSVYTLGQWGFEWLRFLLAPIEPLQLADLAVTTLIWSLALLGHLTVMGVAQGGRRLGVVGVGFCAILGLQLLDHYNESIDWVTTLPYWSRLEPVDPALLPVESVDDFFAAIPELRDELEVLVLEAQEEEEAEEPDVEDESLGVEPPVEPAAQRLRDRPGARV